MKVERRRYLRRTSLADALALWLGHPACARLAAAEQIRTDEALGRVTAEPVFARRSVPHFHCSAVDGVAVTAAETFGASETAPRKLSAGQYTVLDTGDPIPEERDAVIMVEDVRWETDGGIVLVEASRPWQHVRLAGEDLVATEMVLPSGHRLRPADVAALLACGVRELTVRLRPAVCIYPTGDELVDAGAPEEDQERLGAIAETNTHLIAGMVTEWGGRPERAPIVPDRPEAVRAAILAGAERADVVVVNAGSSAGRDDFVPALIAELGELLAHGIDVMPGKPAALGIVGDKPVLGVPGYPVSAYVICEEFLRPLVYRLQGLAVPPKEGVTASMGRKTPSRLGTEEHVRVSAGRVGERLVAVPLPRGASLLSSVVRADGVVRIPAHVEGVDAGEAVRLEPLRPLHEIERALLVIGSHDITLDLLNDFLRRRHPGLSLSSAHVGSLGGLTALRRGECHVAGTHLLDEATGAYNVGYVRRLFGPGEVVLVHLAMREQGLITAPGNPLGLRSLEDVIERGARFINRQRGSGTRMLLEFELKRAGREGQEIAGYDRELYTHLAVAAAVAADGADCGLGVRAAARALHLDFVPVAREQFDLAIRADAWETSPVCALIEVLDDAEFRAAVEALGGYDLGRAGERIL